MLVLKYKSDPTVEEARLPGHNITTLDMHILFLKMIFKKCYVDLWSSLNDLPVGLAVTLKCGNDIIQIHSMSIVI